MPASFVREPFQGSPLRSLRALALHRFLLRCALAGVHVFAWIFIFQYFYLVEPDIAHALARTALLYALSQTITCLVTPHAARSLRGGTRRALYSAVLVAATAFVVLGAAFEGLWGGVSVPLAIAVFAIALGIYRALYWIPYEVEVAADQSPRRVSTFAELLVALAPLSAGLFIAGVTMGPVWILYIGAIVLTFSTIPVLYLRDIHEGFSWGYRETFAQLLNDANRAVVTQAFLEGVSGAALLLFWPLAVFLIVGWSYGMLGLVLSLTFLFAILTRGLVRKGIRRLQLSRSALLNATFAITPWVLRLLVATPLGVVLVDSYFYTTTPRRMGIDPLAFEQAADSGSFVDEYTALKEMGLSLGRIAVCVLGAGVALLVSLPVAFIAVFLTAALASAAAALRFH